MTALLRAADLALDLGTATTRLHLAERREPLARPSVLRGREATAALRSAVWIAAEPLHAVVRAAHVLLAAAPGALVWR